jgi:hypothetical protein
MMCHARLLTESRDAESVSKSLKPDNVGMRFLEVRTSVSGGRIVSDIESGSLTTLLSTIDDLLGCQITSESLIEDG